MKRIKSFSEYFRGLDKNPKINGGRSLIIQGHDVTKLATDIVNFMAKNGVKFSEEKMPKVVFNQKDQKKESPLFNETGNYSPVANLITIFTKDRNLKDILRSLPHELIHADQNMNRGIDTEKAMMGILNKGKAAEKIEADAYKRGNVLFRKWEESLKKSLGES